MSRFFGSFVAVRLCSVDDVPFLRIGRYNISLGSNDGKLTFSLSRASSANFRKSGIYGKKSSEIYGAIISRLLEGDDDDDGLEFSLNIAMFPMAWLSGWPGVSQATTADITMGSIGFVGMRPFIFLLFSSSAAAAAAASSYSLSVQLSVSILNFMNFRNNNVAVQNGSMLLSSNYPGAVQIVSAFLLVVQNPSIWSYMGARSAIWMNNVDTMFNLEIIKLTYCLEWETLPPFRQLPFLKALKLDRMLKVKWLQSEFNGNDIYHPFPSQEVLHIYNLKALEDGSEAGVAVEDGCLLHCLIELGLFECPELKELPSLPPKLKMLKIKDIQHIGGRRLYAGFKRILKIFLFCDMQFCGAKGKEGMMSITLGLDSFGKVELIFYHIDNTLSCRIKL
ncbi:hypothetical protein M5K25_013716 [Dendrobium thyrsiflorum]|uniref:R13L1/DRL21-like LRR repeat region domain-containing protein n=1 Tax=Dendrobium thyrsiflorum TaxID=117978 RepID=A0ABD0UUF2_DENTH